MTPANRPLTLTVNGRRLTATAPPRQHLADFLRETLLLTGTHIGCEHGVCGACTVEIDGVIARSCITLAVACDGAHVRSIEGFDEDPLMASLRDAFRDAHALQCGYCTPGMLIAARDLLLRKGDLDRQAIRIEMSGNLCRCTGYAGMVQAIETLMAKRQGLTLPQRQEPGLAPAPGPAAPETQPTAPAAQQAEAPQAAPAPAQAPALERAAGSKRAKIAVTLSPLESEGRDNLLRQTFVLPHPPETVWLFMRDPVQVAQCLPGLVIESAADDRVDGHMLVQLGPLRARFAGSGTIERFEAERRQIIRGRGSDRGSGSFAEGSIDYCLSAEAQADGQTSTKVDVTMRYGLSGPLAQFGRSGLVRNLVARLSEVFAQTLDARLAAPHNQAAPAALAPAGLVSGLLRDSLTRALARLRRR
jgi:carbon-monoxide dehydrogenase small subunit